MELKVEEKALRKKVIDLIISELKIYKLSEVDYSQFYFFVADESGGELQVSKVLLQESITEEDYDLVLIEYMFYTDEDEIDFGYVSADTIPSWFLIRILESLSVYDRTKIN